MTISEQVEKLLTSDSDRPAWADEILYELREIKNLLQNHTKPIKARKDKAYFTFVNSLRDRMRKEIANDNYPTIAYHDKELGINLKGWIYDKKTSKSLPAYEAFAVYRFLFEHKEDIDKYFIL